MKVKEEGEKKPDGFAARLEPSSLGGDGGDDALLGVGGASGAVLGFSL